MLVGNLGFQSFFRTIVNWRIQELLIVSILAFIVQVNLSKNASAEEVDLALVLAVDVSYSMDVEEQILQKQGYVAALTSPQVISAIQRGRTGKIAVAYLEWAGSTSQYLIVNWQIIKDYESAKQFSNAIANSPLQQIYRTSISEALTFAANLFDYLPFNTTRRTIDISGDGPNNQGNFILDARNQVLAKNITINGLPLLFKRPQDSWFDIPNLDEYYIKCVIGGPSSFSIPVHDIVDFQSALRMKLVLEIASQSLHQNEIDWTRNFVITKTNYDELCTIGERLWDERMKYLDIE